MRTDYTNLMLLYTDFSLPPELQKTVRERTKQAFERLWQDSDFRLYMFYRHKTGKNIKGTLDWVVTKVWKAMGGTGIKTPNVFQWQQKF